jgi:predicted amidohydrolase
MRKLKVAAVALESFPAAKVANLARIEEWCGRASSHGAMLLCFPAMAVTGYWRGKEVSNHAEILKADLTNPALAHPVGPSVKRLEAIAQQLGTHLAAGIVEDLDYYHLRNSVGVFGPTGHLGTAAEMHTPAALHPTYVAGRDCPVFDLDGVTAGVMVGEDVYYPEVARMLATQGARLLIAAMAIPSGGEPDAITRWRELMVRLLATRALENGVAVVAVEAAGEIRHPVEDACYRFVGQAMAFGPEGQLIAETPADSREKMLLADLEIPAGRCKWLDRRRPYLYQPLTAEKGQVDVPGTREKDWNAQGELLWSRLRDLGFFEADLYKRQDRGWERRNRALVVAVPSLPPLEGYRAVVLTRPCLASLAPDEARKLSRWVTGGGTLVLDGYCGRHAETLGRLAGIGGAIRRETYLPSYQDASRVTARVQPAENDAVFVGMDPRRRSKVWGQVWLPGPGAEVSARSLAWLYSPQGERLGPGLYHNAVGGGQVYTFAYCAAYSQLLLMEGRGSTRDLGSFPERIAPDAPRDGDVNMWGDQVVTDAEDQYFPSADYHLIPVLNILRAAVGGHVLVSPVPQGKECGVIFTGDSDRAGAELLNRYAGLLAARGIRPTLFLLRDGYDARKLSANCEVGIHPLFHETERDCFETLVSYGFAPEQLVCGRRHCLVQYGLTDTLEGMAACGVRYTSNNWDFPYPETRSAAFLFGTTMPHHVYNWEGERIGIVDIPQVFMDYQPVLECTQAAYRDVRQTHGVAAWNYHPQNLVMPEVPEAIEWLARQVREDDAWCGTMGEYGKWYERRDAVAVTCEDGAVTLRGEAPTGLALLSRQSELRINGAVSHATRSSTWYGLKYWVHVMRKAEKGAGPICATHPSGRSGKLELSPFPPPRLRVEE